MLRLLWAFLVRDFVEETSYRLSFLMGLFGVIFGAFTFYFLAQLIDERAIPALAQYGTDYFSFVLIGLAFNGYFTVGLNSFSRGLRQAQNTGTLEAMIMTPVPLAGIVVGSAVWGYVYATVRIFVYLLLGAALGVRFSQANVLGGLVTLLLAVIAFASLGIMAAGIITVIKRGDPVTIILTQLAALVGGIYFPISVLPVWLQWVAKLLPITYALDAMRLALLKGAGWAELQPNLLILAVFCLALFPLSLFVFRLAVERARLEGTLTHY